MIYNFPNLHNTKTSILLNKKRYSEKENAILILLKAFQVSSNNYKFSYHRHFKRTPSIEWTPAWVPKFSSHIYRKINLHSVHTSVKWTRSPISSHFVAQTCHKWNFKGFLEYLLKLSSDVLHIVQQCHLKLSGFFQIDAWLDVELWADFNYTVLQKG